MLRAANRVSPCLGSSDRAEQHPSHEDHAKTDERNVLIAQPLLLWQHHTLDSDLTAIGEENDDDSFLLPDAGTGYLHFKPDRAIAANSRGGISCRSRTYARSILHADIDQKRAIAGPAGRRQEYGASVMRKLQEDNR